MSDKDSLHAAIKSSYGVFFATEFWQEFTGTAEEEQEHTVADVCKVGYLTETGCANGSLTLEKFSGGRRQTPHLEHSG